MKFLDELLAAMRAEMGALGITITVESCKSYAPTFLKGIRLEGYTRVFLQHIDRI